MSIKHLRITVNGTTYDVQVEEVGESGVPVDRPAGVARVSGSAAAAPVAAPAAPKPPAIGGAGGEVVSPLAAVVVSVDVQVGQEVTEGAKLVTLEAMKMNTVVSAPHAGKVVAVAVKGGDAVDEGQLLLTLG